MLVLDKEKLKNLANFILFCFQNSATIRAIGVALLALSNANDFGDFFRKLLSLAGASLYFLAEASVYWIEKLGN